MDLVVGFRVTFCKIHNVAVSMIWYDLEAPPKYLNWLFAQNCFGRPDSTTGRHNQAVVNEMYRAGAHSIGSGLFTRIVTPELRMCDPRPIYTKWSMEALKVTSPSPENFFLLL